MTTPKTQSTAGRGRRTRRKEGRKVRESLSSVVSPTRPTTYPNLMFSFLPCPSQMSPPHPFIHSTAVPFSQPTHSSISISTPSPISHQTLPLAFSTTPSLTMPNPADPISPGKLRSDLYGFSCEDEPSTPLVISVLASLLERTIARNERVDGKGGIDVASKDARRRLAFDSQQVLDMSLQSFLERFSRYARVAPPVYVIAYVYMDRLCRFNPGLKICSTNVHRLLITSIMVASKFVEDRNYGNSYFAQVGGISTVELNSLELNFLFLMRFKLHVSVSVFESYCSHLEREVSFGGGYHIERSLKLMCGGEIASRERELGKPINWPGSFSN